MPSSSTPPTGDPEEPEYIYTQGDMDHVVSMSKRRIKGLEQELKDAMRMVATLVHMQNDEVIVPAKLLVEAKDPLLFRTNDFDTRGIRLQVQW